MKRKDPVYNYQTDRLVSAYQKAVKDIYRTLDRIDISNLTRVQQTVTLQEITKILASLNDEAAVWVKDNIPIAVRDGVLTALVSLDSAAAVKVVEFSRMNQNLIATVVADTQADLLAVSKNIERRVRTAIRKAASESMRANITNGISGRRTMNRDTLAGIRKRLGTAAETGIVDAGGRRWRPEAYVDMLTRTKMMEAHKEATMNEALGRGVLYGRISRHGATDACARWEGRIVKLTPDAPGDYPDVGDLPRRDIFHPRCRHLVLPMRNPEETD